jgi:hypothetical protein
MPSEPLREAAAGIQADEERIKSRYKNNIVAGVINVAIMLAAAYELELKWVVAIGFGLTIMTIGAQDARYFDIATRIARTNILLRDLFINRSQGL